MILDSTFIHDVIREDEGAINRLAEFRDAGTPVALSALTVFEVGSGSAERVHSTGRGLRQSSTIS